MEHPLVTNSCSAPASGFGLSEVPVPSCAWIQEGWECLERG